MRELTWLSGAGVLFRALSGLPTGSVSPSALFRSV